MQHRGRPGPRRERFPRTAQRAVHARSTCAQPLQRLIALEDAPRLRLKPCCVERQHELHRRRRAVIARAPVVDFRYVRDRKLGPSDSDEQLGECRRFRKLVAADLQLVASQREPHDRKGVVAVGERARREVEVGLHRVARTQRVQLLTKEPRGRLRQHHVLLSGFEQMEDPLEASGSSARECAHLSASAA